MPIKCQISRICGTVIIVTCNSVGNWRCSPEALAGRLRHGWARDDCDRPSVLPSWICHLLEILPACMNPSDSDGQEPTFQTTEIRRSPAGGPALREKRSILDCWRRNLKHNRTTVFYQFCINWLLNIHPQIKCWVKMPNNEKPINLRVTWEPI